MTTSSLHHCAQLHHYYITPPSFSFTLEQPHGPCVRGMDYNPNKPYHFASCGDDCTVKFWDCRKLDTPLIVRQDHSHWYGEWNWDSTCMGFRPSSPIPQDLVSPVQPVPRPAGVDCKLRQPGRAHSYGFYCLGTP